VHRLSSLQLCVSLLGCLGPDRSVRPRSARPSPGLQRRSEFLRPGLRRRPGVVGMEAGTVPPSSLVVALSHGCGAASKCLPDVCDATPCSNVQHAHQAPCIARKHVSRSCFCAATMALYSVYASDRARGHCPTRLLCSMMQAAAAAARVVCLSNHLDLYRAAEQCLCHAVRRPRQEVQARRLRQRS